MAQLLLVRCYGDFIDLLLERPAPPGLSWVSELLLRSQRRPKTPRKWSPPPVRADAVAGAHWDEHAQAWTDMGSELR